MRTTWTWIKAHPWALVAIMLAMYFIYSQLFNMAARHHFEQHCKNDAGEFIYKTVDNVEGVFQMRPRDPTKYYFDNLRHYQAGTDELIEDPFGHTDAEAHDPHTLFLGLTYKGFHKYNYFETTKEPARSSLYNKLLWPKSYVSPPVVTNEKYWIYTLKRIDKDGKSIRPVYLVKQSSILKSRYGFTWQEARDKWDKFYDIWGGELIVKELATDETLAMRRGYFSFKYGICPNDKSSSSTYLFLSKVLKPSKIIMQQQGEQ